MTEAQETALIVRLYNLQPKTADRVAYSEEIRAMARTLHHYTVQSEEDPSPEQRYVLEGRIYGLLISLRKKGILAPKTTRRSKRKVSPPTEKTDV